MVQTVRNDLEIVPSSKEEVVSATDDELDEKVEDSLERRAAFGGVEVEVKNGVARLTGTVAHPEDRLDAAMIARSQSGVRSVHDEIAVSD